MNKNRVRKEKLYDIYSQNLSWVKKHPKISFKPDFDKGYICPLCLNLFTEEALNETFPNHLTFDHNPPKSLGGKQGILTCKDCNSKAGHKLDNHLLSRLQELDFLSFMTNSKGRTVLEIGNNKVNSDISIDEKGAIKINIDRKNSNPLHVNNFLNSKTYNYKAYDPFLQGHDFFSAAVGEPPTQHCRGLVFDLPIKPIYNTKLKKNRRRWQTVVAGIEVWQGRVCVPATY